MAVALAVVMAMLAAVLFAVAAVAQNGAVATVVGLGSPGSGSPGSGTVLHATDLRALTRSRTWLAGISLTSVASVVHAGALVLAPVAVVQPIGVLSVPIAVVVAARRSRVSPPPAVRAAVTVCLLTVAGFVVLANAELGQSPAPRFVGVLAAALAAAAVAGLLALYATRTTTGWVRCVAFAASGATAFGLVSALMRLVSLHLTSGIDDFDDVGVWLPAIGIVAALVGGGWAVQQAHAAGPPAVVVGCLTVIDPLVAVTLGATMLGEGAATSAGPVLALAGLAVLALSAAVFLARHHPARGARL